MKQVWKTALTYCTILAVLFLCVMVGNRAVTVFSENMAVAGRHCVVIDPGHGGEDGGAVSHSGLPESGYNLEISLRLNDMLNLLGCSTKRIRTTDVSVYQKGDTLSEKKASDLKERVRILRETENAVLLSIHQNHYPDERYSGAQVFYAKTEGSAELAKQLQSALVSVLNPGSRRQEKKSSGIYLMEHVDCPAVLIECGFLSNAEEDRKLQDPEYQKKLCAVIAATTCQYLSNP